MKEINVNDIVRFNDGNLELEVRISPDEDTVWLTQDQMAELFGTSRTNVIDHIGNIYKENELDENSTSRKFRQVQKEGKRNVKRNILYFNLDMIISVGYRVKSIRGIQFRKWANRILKDYMMKGYAINRNRFDLTVLDNALKLLDNAKLDGNFLLDAEQMLGVFYLV